MENLGNIVGVLIYAYDFLLDSPDSRLFSRARSQGFPSLQVSRYHDHWRIDLTA